MTAIITFVIPVRHPENSSDWAKLKSNLAQTVHSINQQTHPYWRAVIVANRGADLPELPEKVEVVYVDFPPNALYKKAGISDALFYDATRLDKGRRVLMGMMAIRDTRFYMVVDDDDLINRRLVGFLAQQKHVNGWKVKEGYVWSDAGRMLLVNRNFHHLCGTSLIISSDLFNLPKSIEDVSADNIKKIYGSHITVVDYLSEKGVSLNPLPFRAAIYRVGYSGSHSQAPTLSKRLLNRKMLLRPIRLISHLFNLRLLTLSIKNEFF